MIGRSLTGCLWKTITVGFNYSLPLYLPFIIRDPELVHVDGLKVPIISNIAQIRVHSDVFKIL